MEDWFKEAMTKNWFTDAINKQMAREKSEGKLQRYGEVVRIVSYETYAEAEKAQNAGATPRQIEMCLMGMSWEQVQKESER